MRGEKIYVSPWAAWQGRCRVLTICACERSTPAKCGGVGTVDLAAGKIHITGYMQ